MENTNFSASKLEKTASSVLTSLKHDSLFIQYSTCGVSAPWESESDGERLSRVVESEDSNLAQTWRNTIEISSEVASKLYKLIEKIENEMAKYAAATVENENVTSDMVSDINSSLESNKDALSQLDF